MTNKAVREFVMKQFPKNAAIAKKLRVNVKEEIHLDPDHQAFILFEAPNAEAVRDYLVQGGYTHFSRLSFHLVTPVADILQQADKIPTVYQNSQALFFSRQALPYRSVQASHSGFILSEK